MLIGVANLSAGKKIPYAMETAASKEVHNLFLKAIQANDTTKMEMFLQYGAKVYCYDGWWFEGVPHGDPLLTAINADARDAVRILIKKDRRTLLPRYGKVNRQILKISPLLYALQKRKGKCYRILDMAIFEPAEGDSCLNKDIKEMTLSYGDDDFFDIVLGHNYTCKTMIAWVDTLEARGFKLSQKVLNEKMATSVSPRDTAVAKFFLDRGADPNYIHTDKVPRSRAGMIPAVYNVLISATQDGNNDLAKYLIERGAGVNVSVRQWSPLYMAVQRADNLDFIKYLVEKGADVNFSGKAETRRRIKVNRAPDSVLSIARPEYKEFLIINGAR
jgi:ankyrin repeat protein